MLRAYRLDRFEKLLRGAQAEKKKMKQTEILTQDQAEQMVSRGDVALIIRSHIFRQVDGWIHCVTADADMTIYLIDQHGRVLGALAGN